MSEVTVHSGEHRPLACSSRRLAGNMSLEVDSPFNIFTSLDIVKNRSASRRAGQASRLLFASAKTLWATCGWRSCSARLCSPDKLLLLLLTFYLALFTSHAAPPDRREVWVPITQLKSVLEKNPRAVLLTKEQYDTLLRDAGVNTADPAKPPVQAVVVSADYTSTPDGKTLRTIGKLTVEVLTDDWTIIPLQMDGGQIAQVQVDGNTAARAADNGLQLVIRGKGKHTVTLETVQPVTSNNGENASQFSLPATSAGSLKIVLPPGATSPGMVVRPFTDRAEILHAFSGPAGILTAKWRPADPSGGVAGSLSQECSFFYQIDSASIRADLGITLSAAMGKLPETLRLPVPANCKIVEVVGDDIASWTIDQAVLTIRLTANNTGSTTFRVVADALIPAKPSEAANTSQSSLVIGHFPFPFLTVENTRRISGIFGLIGSNETAIRSVDPGTNSQPVSGVFAARLENDPRFAGAWRFNSSPGPITAEVVRLTPAFDADLDTGISFQQDGIHLDRTITLRKRDGEIFTLRLHLPPGEQLITVKNANKAEADFRQEGDAIIIALHNSGVFHLQTRVEPPDWPTLPEGGREFSPASLVVDRVGKISGYLAVNSDPSFRVETMGDDGLEPRDGRITPVKGDFAWFGRGEAASAALKLRVTRRPAEISAQVAGYALPAANTLEINAHIDFQIARSGVRTLRVKIPGAENFHLDGPGIAERTLGGEKKDTWTITFQKEQTGNYGLRVTGQIPMTRDDAESGKKAGRFHVTVPTIEPLDAPRFGSTWAVEANTDTEIHFDTTGLNELDNLRAPAIADYTPRHRIIGVYGSLGAVGSLTLRGERHVAATLPAIVVDRLDLTSILSTSGMTRHQAMFTARNAGEQFLEVRLPAGAKLWSVTVGGEPVKPVQSGPDAVRIALPQRDAETPLSLGLVYETTGREWSGSGSQNLVAPKLDHAIPILRSKWTVWLPEGQSYERLTSNLPHQENPAEDLLLARLWSGVHSKAGTDDAKTLAASGISNPNMRPPSDIPSYHSYQQAAPAQTRSQAVWEVNRAWERPVTRYGSGEASSGVKSTDNITAKLNTIIVPRIEFRDATIREAIDYLKSKSRDLDPESDPAKKGVNIVLKLGNGVSPMPTPSIPEIPGLETAAVEPGSTPITLSLSNVPMIEALKYVTALANLKLKIEPDGVSIVPLSTPTEELITRSYRVSPNMLTEGNASGAGAKIAARISAKDLLTAQGVEFPPGSKAVFEGNKIIVTNTRAGLDLVDALLQADNPSGSQNTAGLLPLTLNLEPVGKPVVFEGAFEAESVHVSHLDWWNRGRRMWVWLVLGGLAFVVVGSRKPFSSLFWGMLLFTFIPVCLSRAWTLECNALLAGWIAAFVGVLLYRWCRPRRRMELDAMERSEA